MLKCSQGAFPASNPWDTCSFPTPIKNLRHYDTGVAIIIFQRLYFLKEKKNHVNAAICHLHIHHNIPCLLPKISHNLCYCFLPGYYSSPKRKKRPLVQKFLFLGGGNKAYFGRCANGKRIILIIKLNEIYV